MAESESWPPLPLHEWQDTYRTLHMWTQIVGKIRMTLSPPLNQWWHVTLYVNSRGLTTGPVPYPPGLFEIQFDFLQHQLTVRSSEGAKVSRPLRAESVAAFYEGLFATLRSLGISVEIDRKPQEVADPVPFDRDTANGSYDPNMRAVFGASWCPAPKCSSGSARSSPANAARCTFSGAVLTWRVPASPAVWRRPARVSSAARLIRTRCLAPASGQAAESSMARRTTPTPSPSRRESKSSPYGLPRPHGTRKFSEFILMYDDVRRAASPEESLYEFLESTYAAGANLAGWDRAALEV